MTIDIRTRPSVSVVIPVYNGARTIERALNSVYTQTYNLHEVIVVNDASTDETRNLILSYKRLSLHLIDLDANCGASRARNVGVAAATGEYVAFLDADDEWHPNKIERQVAVIKANPRLTLVACQGTIYSSDGSVIGAIYAGTPRDGDTAWQDLLKSCTIKTSCVLARRDQFMRIGGFDEGMPVAEDQDLWIRLAMAGEVAWVNEDLVSVHVNEKSLMHQYVRQEPDYVIPMIKRHVDSMRKKLKKRQIREILRTRYATIGRNIYVSGSCGKGALLIIRAIILGENPLKNISFIFLASPLSRFLKNAIRS